MEAKFKTPFAFVTPWVVAGLLIVLCSVVLFLRYPAKIDSFAISPPTDFSVYLRARDRVRSGVDPYIVSDPSPYKYSPGALALVDLLPQEPARAWLAFSTLCILALAASMAMGARYHSWESVGLLFLGLCLSWKGILETLDYGQLEILVLVMAIAASALQRRQPVLAGLLAGTLPWFKLPWVLFVFPLILVPVPSLSGKGRKVRRVRLLISGYLFSWFIWGAAVPSLVYGSDRARNLTHSWLALLGKQPASLFLSDINQSLWVSALRWSGGSPKLAFGLVAILGGLILGAAVSRSLKLLPSREVFAWVSPWLVLTQLLNPLSWRWGSVFLIGVPFSVQSAPRKWGALRWTLASLAVLLWLLQLNPVVIALGGHHWSELHAYGAVTLYWLALLLLTL